MPEPAKSRLFAGTSGFSYPAWKPAFYPEKLAAAKFLAHYATRLNSVEINYTFRHLPSAKTLEGWVNSTPEGFAFALKAPMRLTHIMRLKNAAEFTEVFLKSIDPLRAVGRLGPVLYQLPPTLKFDAGLLSDYLPLLPKDIRFTFEFRHASWLTPATYDLLSQHGVGLCLAESEKLETPEVITADFVYSRLRKADYSAEDRQRITSRAAELLAAGKDVYIYFKHEDDPSGALYAEEIIGALTNGCA